MMDNHTVAIIVIGAVEIVALLTGHDGIILTTAIGAIAAIGGYSIGKNAGGE